jgi:hypothetical protein
MSRAAQASSHSPRLIRAKRAASEYGFPYSTFRTICFRGGIAVVKCGRAWYVERADVERWIADNKGRV